MAQPEQRRAALPNCYHLVFGRVQDMNIRFLETFVWLARLQNFRLTAEQLHTTQAAVSNRIAALETNFGTRLFNRTARAATLTPAGLRLLGYAERIVRLDSEMRHEATDSDDGGGALIRIGMIETIVHGWFPDLMSLIREYYPRLELEVTSDTSIDLAKMLRAGSVDLVLQTDTLDGPEIENIALTQLPMRWVASPSFELMGKSIGLQQLAELPIISFSRHSGPHASLHKLLSVSGERPPRIHCISSVAAMIRLVVDGFGVAVLPPSIIQAELAAEKLHLVETDTEFPNLPLVASIRNDSHPLANRIAELTVHTSRRFAESRASTF